MSKQQVDKLAWFPLYTSDYLGDTTGLSCCEHGAYLLMLIEYWQHGPLDDNLDRLARITQNPPPEIIRYILEKYWLLTNFGWEQPKMRKIKEIQVESHQKRVKSGRLGGKAKASNAIAMLEQCSSNAPSNGGSNALATQNSESRIQNTDLRAQRSDPRSNLEIKTRETRKPSRSAPAVPKKLDFSSWPEMPSDQVMQDWVSMRKDKRSKISQTVVDRLAKELHKAAAVGMSVDDCLSECVVRGWQGFKFEWMQNSHGQSGGGKQFKTKQEIIQERNAKAADDFVNDRFDDEPTDFLETSYARL